MGFKNFFNEIVDVPKYERFTVYGVGAVIFLVLFWVYVAIPEYSKEASIFLFMLIIWIFGLSFDLVWDVLGRKNQAAVNGVGKKPIPALVVGIVLGLVVAGSAFAIVPFSIVSSGWLAFLFIVVAAPFAEANFFRGVIQPTFVLLLEDWSGLSSFWCGVVATVAQSGAFALFHVNVLGSASVFDVYAYVPYFLFGVIATVLVYGTRSVASEYGLHGVNNLFAFFRLGGF